ncbi:protein-glutamate O-methyltransferase family protein [Saccharopolyspora rhizosphaerae]|uniref:Protein-glutamate O-methyltransferase family protein n=2 Tax=Saccharopolyspora rhizosphaerae TaxID=2492662 RepID=A0A3R8QZE5_9PSEU|nr:protein-glutamate O-methyltransferase family protein [Saccharopolyspora rhizosphaerae]
MIERLCAAHPFGPDVREALTALLEESTRGVVEPLDDDAPDHDVWAAWTEGQLGRPWAEMSFLWAESYFFRKLLGATGYFAPGPWRGVDPFAPMKRAELGSDGTAETLAALDSLPQLADADRDTAVVQAAVWGNQADLAFQLSTDASGTTSGLVSGSAEEFWSLFGQAGQVHLVADNAAGELSADLVLIDRLLTTGRAEAVVLHVKPNPYYVSDAIPNDVIEVLHQLVGSAGEASAIGHRVQDALRDGRIAVRAHPFFCAPREFSDMPDDLRAEFSSAAVTIFKGDLNYRRLVGDRHWEPTRPFADAVSHFPSPLAALRVLKSEAVVGLSADTVSSLDEGGEAWRTQGSHALVQTRS